MPSLEFIEKAFSELCSHKITPEKESKDNAEYLNLKLEFHDKAKNTGDFEKATKSLLDLYNISFNNTYSECCFDYVYLGKIHGFITNILVHVKGIPDKQRNDLDRLTSKMFLGQITCDNLLPLTKVDDTKVHTLFDNGRKRS